jgi:hypothetical protein
LTFTLVNFFDVDQMSFHPWSKERDQIMHKKEEKKEFKIK